MWTLWNVLVIGSQCSRIGFPPPGRVDDDALHEFVGVWVGGHGQRLGACDHELRILAKRAGALEEHARTSEKRRDAVLERSNKLQVFVLPDNVRLNNL